MNHKNATLIVSLIIIFAICAACWYVLLWDQEFLQAMSLFVPRLYTGWVGKILLALTGLITLACSVSLFLLIIGYEPGRNRQVVLKNESGSIGVSLHAVEEFLKRRCKSIPGVKDLTVKTDVVDNALVVQTKLILELQKNVPEFTKAFQERIRADLENTLGLTNIREVKVLIKKIFPRDTPAEAVYLGTQPQLLLKESAPERDEAEEKPLEVEDAAFTEDEKEYTVVAKPEKVKEEQA